MLADLCRSAIKVLLIASLSFVPLTYAVEPTLVAKSNSAVLRSEDLKALLAGVSAETQRLALVDDANLEQFLRSELVRRSLLAQGRTAGLDNDATLKAMLDRARDELVVRLLVEQHAALPVGYPSEAEVKAAYDAGVAVAVKTFEYHLAQVFVALPDGAPADTVSAGLSKVAVLQARLPKGDFGQLAKEYSEHADSAAKGGDLGFLEESRLLPEVRSVLVNAKPGSLIGPVKTSQGLHFFKLLDRRAVVVPTLESLHDSMVEALRQQQRSQLTKAYLEQAARDAGITINQIELAQFRTALVR